MTTLYLNFGTLVIHDLQLTLLTTIRILADLVFFVAILQLSFIICRLLDYIKYSDAFLHFGFFITARFRQEAGSTEWSTNYKECDEAIWYCKLAED